MIYKKLSLLILLFITTLLSSLTSASLFGHKKHGDDGERKSIFDLLVTDERFTRLIQHIEETNLTSTFKNLKAGTVFAPVNEAFEHDGKFITQRKLTAEQLLYHVIPIACKSDELYDGRLLETKAHIDHVTLLVKVSKSLKNDIEIGTGNEDVDNSKVIEADMDAANGVIHLVDKVLSLPVYLDETLASNKNTQEFYELAKKARITHDLKNAKGNTIFVAKGDFFGDALSPVERRYLVDQEAGRKDLARFLNHQISPKIYYSEDFKEGKSRVPTVEGSEDLDIVVKHNKVLPSSITVNGVKVTYSDILSANGVIHVLESPILPKDNKKFLKLNARKALAGMNATRFIQLFDENGLGSYLDSDQSDVITILAPPNDALDEDQFADVANKKSWLKYHIVHGRYAPSDLKNGQLLETESHDNLDESAFQHIDVHLTNQDPDFIINDKLIKQSIQFGKSGVLGDPVEVGDNLLIYPIARSLVLPRDPLSRLPVNLELSTFVASLYASGADDAIGKSHGLTLFAPTNEAFGRLGLLAKYLLQPDSKKKLEQVATFHAVRGVFYDYTTSEGEHREPTLSSGAEIILNKTGDGFFVRGSGAADGSDRNIIAQVVDADILTSNGVIHTIDRVQLPGYLEITNRNLLSAEGTNSLLNLLERAKLTDKVLDGFDKNKPYTVLAPSDRAFGKLNLSRLLEDPDKLLEIARLHILPIALPRLDLGETATNSYGDIFGRKNVDSLKDNNKKDKESRDVPWLGVDLPTLLDDEYVVISKNIAAGGYSVKVKGSLMENADVTDIGRATSSGGVIVIDRVLVPKEVKSERRWPWWVIALIVIGSLVGAAILAVAAYLGWRYYKSHREGYISLDHGN